MIEIMVAISVLTIGVLGVAAFFANSAKLTRIASNESAATNFAQGYIDDEIAKDYASIPVNITNTSRVDSDSSSPYYNFYRTITANYIDVGLNSSETDIGLKRIVVMVNYTENGQNKNVTLQTIVTKK